MAFSADKLNSANPRPDFDPAVADQISMVIITQGQQNYQTNAAMARNELGGQMTGLTLGVQRANMAAIHQQTSLHPLEAAAAANAQQASAIMQFARLNTA